jgi:hypothetical protein
MLLRKHVTWFCVFARGVCCVCSLNSTASGLCSQLLVLWWGTRRGHACNFLTVSLFAIAGTLQVWMRWCSSVFRMAFDCGTSIRGLYYSLQYINVVGQQSFSMWQVQQDNKNSSAISNTVCWEKPMGGWLKCNVEMSTPDFTNRWT